MSKEMQIAVIGAPSVGKTAIIVQLTQSMFQEEYTPTGDETYSFMFDFQDSQIKLNLYDTAGGEAGAAAREEKYAMADGFIAVYSICCTETFSELKQYLEKLKEVKENKKFPIVLVANKSDQQEIRQVNRDEGEELAKELGCPFVEITAREKDNVMDVFNRLIQEINKMAAEKDEKPPPEKKKGGCCAVL